MKTKIFVSILAAIVITPIFAFAQTDSWDVIQTKLNRLLGEVESLRLEINKLAPLQTGTAYIPGTPTPDAIPPTIPQNLTATSLAQSRVRLSWSPSTDNAYPVAYRMYRNGTYFGATEATSFIDGEYSPLLPNTTYVYLIRAYDLSPAANMSGASAVARVTTSIPPSGIIKFQPNDEVKTTARLNVRREPQTTATSFAQLPLGTVGYIISGPQLSEGYNWWKVSFSGVSVGYAVEDYLTKSTGITLTTAGTGYGFVSSVPAGIGCGTSCYAPFAENTQVTLIAVPAIGSAFSGWQSTDPGFLCTTATSCTVTMDRGRRIQATFITANPNSPSGLTATAVSQSKINVRWIDTSNNEEGFRIYRLNAGAYYPIGTVSAGVTTYQDTGLSSGTNISYRVKSYNNFGESLDGTTVSATTLPSTKVYYVSPTGNDNGTGLSAGSPWKTIQKAVNAALPGDTVNLAGGVYLQDIASTRAGTEDARITIIGPGAIIKGAGKSHVIDLNHNYMTLNGFTVDGLFGTASPDVVTNYREKLIYVLGKAPLSGVNGLKILNMNLLRSKGECMRVRYFAQNNEFAFNNISNCGIQDFIFFGGAKNGEAIYLGTDTGQLTNGINPTADPDQSKFNWIHHNNFNTHGAECVDVKEAATENMLEYNDCTGQIDDAGGAINLQGNNNTVRYNTIYGAWGAGVRLGGMTATDGINNNIYGNTIHDNRIGGVKFQVTPQAKVCGNTMFANQNGNSVGTYKNQFNPVAVCL